MRKHIKTVNKAMLNKTLRTGGCGECPASCQSACKTSCTVGNQVCEHSKYFLNTMQLPVCCRELFYYFVDR